MAGCRPQVVLQPKRAPPATAPASNRTIRRATLVFPDIRTARRQQPAPRREERTELALQTAEDVATTLGAMEGVLMKIGQMASYVDDGLSPAVRRTLAGLQDSVPRMSPELAATVGGAGAAGTGGVALRRPLWR
jgi:predicted unusual protein kinase regulating ubiquinone biosynthesis (AarF/ABC1/UbiB family)